MNLKIIYLFMLSLLLIITIRAQIEFPPDATLPDYQSGKGNEIPPTIIHKEVIPSNGPDVRINPSTYHQSQLSIAISPVDERVLLASADINQSGGLGIGIGYYYSTDGGNVWNGSDELPSGCSNASNPAVVIDNNGYFYVGSINFSYGQGIMRSTDNGASWTYYTVANAQEPEPLYVLGNNHLVIDNTGGQYNGYLYSAWSNFAYWPTRRIEFARSTDQGQTWVTTAVISSGIPNGHTFGHQGVNLQVGYDGTIYACWAVRDSYPPFTERGIGFNKSTDGGLTWEIPHYAINNIFGIRAPDGYSEILPIGTNSFPVMAIDNLGDKIYISWINVGVPGVNTGDPDVYIISSVNQGVSWSTPIRVNTDQLDNNAIQFHSWLSVDQTTGDVYVAFYDNRGNINSNIWEFYLAKSFDKGETFTDFAVSDDAFSINPIWGFYFGNYIGLTASLGSVYPVWNAQNPLSISQAWLSKVDYQVISIDQKKEDGTRMTFTNIGRWNGSSFYDIQIKNNPAKISIKDEGNEVLRGRQQSYVNQKYNNWNILPDVTNHHVFTIDEDLPTTLTSNFKSSPYEVKIKNSLEGTTLIGGDIQIFDPWYIDFQDEDYGNSWRNRGMEEPHQFYNRSIGTSGWQPDLTTVYQEGPYPYNGIFLDQPIVSGQPYYKVGMPEEQTIFVNGQNRKFFPYKWTGSGVNFQDEYERQTGVVFTSTEATATAVLKGQLISNDQNGVNNPSQRKMIRTDNGQYHVVYESMGTVFYTYSLTSDFYGAWSADEYLHYHGKNPAIDYDGNTVKIVFEYYDPQVGGNATIQLVTYELGLQMDYEEVTSYSNSYYGNAKPVISYTQWDVFIAYRTGPTGAIKQRTKWSDALTWWWGNEADIPGTNADCINPSVTGFRQPGNTTFVHIAYENFGAIYFREAYRIAASWTYSSAPVNLSARSGFNLNRYPVISLSNNSANRYLMVSWQGIYNGTPTNPLPKIDGTKPLYRQAAVVKTGYGTSWSTSSSFSNNVDYTNNGSMNTSFGSIMTWSESNGQYSKYVKKWTPTGYDPITPLTPIDQNGIQTLVCNGSEFGNMKAMVFKNSGSAPFFLNRCTNDFTYIPDGMGKITESGVVDISYGRSGIVEKNGIEFVFNIGDVLLDGETIKFIERADSLPITNIEELNLAVKSDTLDLNTESELIFSDYYYVVFGEKADSLLSNEFNVNFKCELVKLSTSEVVGVFEEVNYNKTNLDEYGQEGYLIDCSGIEAGKYYLRLTTTVNEEVGLSLSDIQMDNVVLEKSELNIRNFKGSTIPLEYSLEQNYPNPFNPTTTIRYQLPKDGLVTMKVYDILGAEVTTLVNEEKVAGKYEVNFDASRLASGVYIYRLNVNDPSTGSGQSYVNVKKMVLVK